MEEKEALLSQLKGVHLPQVSAVPAMGWWILMILFIVLAIAAVWFRRRYKSLQWQREAKQTLSRIREQATTRPVSATLADSSRLARQVLLAVKPREAVANLHGNDWLLALDDVCQRPLFASGFGQLLESTQYQRDPQINPADMDALLDAMEEFIRSSARIVRPPSSSLNDSRKVA